MAPRKTERILNLTICLLSTNRYIPRERIREAIEGYSGLSDAAFERTFERDKDELRDLGVPIETGSNDAFFDDEQGYRIRRTDFELPSIALDADEAAVVGVAARAWRQASMNNSTLSALAKLRAAGVDPDTSRLTSLEPSVAANEPAFEILVDAMQDRVRVQFSYREADVRTLEPWGMTSSKGRWYVIGYDTDRDATRMFKVSRIVGLPSAVSKPGAFHVPADLDLRALAQSLAPRQPTATALLAVRGEKAPNLRRRGSAVALPDRTMPGGIALPDGFGVFEVGFHEPSTLASEIAGYAADVVVLGPAELRALVISQLRAVSRTHGEPSVA